MNIQCDAFIVANSVDEIKKFGKQSAPDSFFGFKLTPNLHLGVARTHVENDFKIFFTLEIEEEHFEFIGIKFTQKDLKKVKEHSEKSQTEFIFSKLGSHCTINTALHLYKIFQDDTVTKVLTPTFSCKSDSLVYFDPLFNILICVYNFQKDKK